MIDTEILQRPIGRTGIMQIKRAMEKGQELAYLDVGFGIWLDLEQSKVKELGHKNMVTAIRKGSGINVQSYSGKRSDLWLYRARLDHVVDGDTAVVAIECGLDVNMRQILRLRSVNANSLSEESGIKAREFVLDKLEQASYLLVKTIRRDKYARLVADILIAHDGQSESEVLENGLFLNQELLNRELASFSR